MVSSALLQVLNESMSDSDSDEQNLDPRADMESMEWLIYGLEVIVDQEDTYTDF